MKITLLAEIHTALTKQEQYVDEGLHVLYWDQKLDKNDYPSKSLYTLLLPKIRHSNPMQKMHTTPEKQQQGKEGRESKFYTRSNMA